MTIAIASTGYVTPYGDTVCDRCSRKGDELFVGESDVPHHCIECEDLLPIPLTGEGRNYVANEILEYLATGSPNGRPEVLLMWADYYWDEAWKTVADRMRGDLTDSELFNIVYGTLVYRASN